jgi:hypothetical protein
MNLDDLTTITQEYDAIMSAFNLNKDCDMYGTINCKKYNIHRGSGADCIISIIEQFFDNKKERKIQEQKRLEDNIFHRRLLQEINKENPNVELLKFLDKKVDKAIQLITIPKIIFTDK